MDAGLAKILNSTVGTSAVKALDKVLDGVIDDVLTRNRSLVASAEPYFVFPQVLHTWYANLTTTEKSLVTFTMPLSGSVYLEYNFGATSNNLVAYLSIYKNNVLYKEIADGTPYSSSDPHGQQQIDFSKGDVIDIRARYGSGEGRVFANLFSLNASLVQGSKPTNVTVKV